MESLALLVTVIFLAMILCGLASAVLVIIPRRATRIVGVILSLPAIAIGVWILVTPVGMGARVLGALIALAGLSALGYGSWQLARNRREARSAAAL